MDNLRQKQPKQPPDIPKIPLPPIPAVQANQPVGKETEIIERRYQAMELRRQGYSFVRIGMALGVSDKTAAIDVRYCLQHLVAITAEKTEEFRALNSARLEKIIETIWTKCEAADLWAIDRILVAIDQHSKLNGLNKPVTTVIGEDPDLPFGGETRKEKDDALVKLFTKLANVRTDLPGDIIDVTPDPEAIPEKT